MVIFRLPDALPARPGVVSSGRAAAVVMTACGGGDRPRLARGAAAPDFSLPGIDGKPHSLR